MARRIVTLFLIAAFFLTTLPSPALAAGLEKTPLEKIAVVEQILYGAEQEGSLVDRTAKLEKDLFGLPGREPLMTKVDHIHAYVRDSGAGSPSLVFKMGALEWSLTQALAKGPLKPRLESLEKTVSGTAGTGAIDARVSRLMAITFPGSRLDTGRASLAKDTLVKIKLTQPLESKKNKVGDPVAFEVAEDVYAGGMLVLPKGAPGKGRLTKVEQAQNFGRDAKMEAAFETVEALDMTAVATLLGEKAKKETQSMAAAAGAGVAGMILLGPIGVVGAAFVHGKNITIPTGTTLYIQTQNDTELVGWTVK